MRKKVDSRKPKVPPQILVLQEDSWLSSFMQDTKPPRVSSPSIAVFFWGEKVGKGSLALKVLFMMWKE